MLHPVLSLALAAVPQSLPAAPRPPAAEVVDLVEVRIPSAREWGLLRRFASDIDDHFHVAGRARIFAGDAEQARLRQVGLALEVLREDLAAQRGGPVGSQALTSGGSFAGYRTYDEMALKLLQLSTQYPSIVSQRFSLGTTWEGRPIWAVRVSDQPNAHDPSEPVVWYDALHHAREPIGGEALLRFLEHMVTSYSSDAEVRRLIDSNNLLFVPCVNPDGYEFNRALTPSGGGMWRKNKAQNADGSLGVDLNRNYDWEWGPQWPGSSSYPGDFDFHGPAPFSEPETRALRDLAAQSPPDVVVSCHSYGEYCLLPWGYDAVTTPDDAVLRGWSESLVGPLGWGYGTPWETVGFANGSSLDYLYGSHGSLALALEIGSAADGFWPQGARIDELCDELLPVLQRAARLAGAAPRLVDAALVESSGDGDGWKEPGELWTVVVTVENEGRQPVAGEVSLGLPGDLCDLATPPVTLELAPHEVRALQFGFRIAPDAPRGVRRALRARFQTEHEGFERELGLAVGEGRPLLLEDFAYDEPGWLVEGQGAGAFERAAPQAVIDPATNEATQPAGDAGGAPGGLCFVTGAAAGVAASDHDVDGWTRLTSPRLDLADFEHAELELTRWFAALPDSGPAEGSLRLELSNDDGASWRALAELEHHNAWSTARHDLAAVLPLTSAMRLRLTARDEPDSGLTEALVDDLRVLAITDQPRLTAFGRSRPGDAPRLFLCAPGLPGRSVALHRALAAGPGATSPGVAGALFLEGPTPVVWSGTLDPQGCAVVPVALTPLLVPLGGELCFQALIDGAGPDAAWTNLARLPIEGQ